MTGKTFLAFVLVLLAGFATAAQAETVLLRSAQNGGYVGIGGDGYLLAGYARGRALRLERVELHGNDKVAFRTADGLYVRGGVGSHTGVTATSRRIGGWETFQQVPVRQGWVAFMSMQNGRFLTLAEDGRSLVVTDERISGRSAFIIEPVAGAGRPPQQDQNAEGNQPGGQQGGQHGVPAGNPMRELAAYWNVEQVAAEGGRMMRPLVRPRAIEFFIDRAGNVHATAGCRRVTSQAQADARAIRFSGTRVSRENCSNNPDAFMTEHMISEALRHARRWRIVRGKLVLQTGGGRDLMVLSRR